MVTAVLPEVWEQKALISSNLGTLVSFLIVILADLSSVELVVCTGS